MPEQVASEAQSPAEKTHDVVDLAPKTNAWDAFVARSNPGSYLQTSAWAEVKAPNGWTPLRFMGTCPVPLGEGDPGAGGDGPAREAAFGAQLLLRRPRVFPWAFAYSPRGPVMQEWNGDTVPAFTAGMRKCLAAWPGRVSHVRIEPEIELDGPDDEDGALRHALRQSGWRPGAAIQPPRTRQVDLRVDEAALWSGLRKKWRQYVNKARKGGIRVVDAPVERLPEFYEIYRETAARAGFVIRTYESYLAVWDAFARLGMARLLMAETSEGEGLATLFVLRVGDKVVEPYGGMTARGADARANYLLKWEAIRSSREAGAVSYDMWGISHGGIEHFKAGFGGREIRYVGAWDLVLDPAGRFAYDTAQGWQDRVGRLRHGIFRVRGGRREAAGEPQEGTAGEERETPAGEEGE
jgi:peptidoglycan pentaglycine glycine transferase (the first glycine)